MFLFFCVIPSSEIIWQLIMKLAILYLIKLLDKVNFASFLSGDKPY